MLAHKASYEGVMVAEVIIGESKSRLRREDGSGCDFRRSGNRFGRLDGRCECKS